MICSSSKNKDYQKKNIRKFKGYISRKLIELNSFQMVVTEGWLQSGFKGALVEEANKTEKNQKQIDFLKTIKVYK